MLDKPYSIIVFSSILYIFMYTGCGPREREDSIKAPVFLRKVILPFIRYEKIPIGFLVIGASLLLSNLFVYIKYFIQHLVQGYLWDWKIINAAWYVFMFISFYIMLFLTAIILTIRAEYGWSGRIVGIAAQIGLLLAGIYLVHGI